MIIDESKAKYPTISGNRIVESVRRAELAERGRIGFPCRIGRLARHGGAGAPEVAAGRARLPGCDIQPAACCSVYWVAECARAILGECGRAVDRKSMREKAFDCGRCGVESEGRN